MRAVFILRIKTAVMEHQSVNNNSISLCRRVYNSKTRTYVRLLGPCFKTGRIEPFSHQSARDMCPKGNPDTGDGSRMSSTRHVRSPGGKLPCPWSFPQLRTEDDTQGKKHRARPAQNLPQQRGLKRQAITIARNNLAKQTGSIRFPFSNFRHF